MGFRHPFKHNHRLVASFARSSIRRESNMVNAREITHYNHHKLWKGVLAGSLVFSAFAITTGLLFPEILPKFYYNNKPAGSFTSHAAISILSNLNFDAAHGVNSGNGSSANPY